jgi:5-bromo-4-chloroindolyl phosphate hydrolysis protein
MPKKIDRRLSTAQWQYLQEELSDKDYKKIKVALEHAKAAGKAAAEKAAKKHGGRRTLKHRKSGRHTRRR